MKEIGISIIIPALNPGEFLISMLESIYNLRHSHPFEVIVVNDGSTDEESLRFFEQAKLYKNLTLLSNSKCMGTQFSRNKGLSIAKYKYIMTCDADDMFNTKIDESSYMSQAIDILESSDDIAFAYCPSMMFGDFEGYTVSAYPVSYKQILMKHHAQQTIIYRADDIPIHKYDTDIKKWTDWSFVVALLNSRFKKGKLNKIKFIDKPFHKYRIHSSPNRMSMQNYSEQDMVRITVEKNMEIYRTFFANESVEEISKLVTDSKPNRLVDLLYIANYNLERAVQMAKERSADIVSSAPDCVP
jgi:glycosyltransferase involved in cell wall biosynthesis